MCVLRAEMEGSCISSSFSSFLQECRLHVSQTVEQTGLGVWGDSALYLPLHLHLFGFVFSPPLLLFLPSLTCATFLQVWMHLHRPSSLHNYPFEPQRVSPWSRQTPCVFILYSMLVFSCPSGCKLPQTLGQGAGSSGISGS